MDIIVLCERKSQAKYILRENLPEELYRLLMENKHNNIAIVTSLMEYRGRRPDLIVNMNQYLLEEVCEYCPLARDAVKINMDFKERSNI